MSGAENPTRAARARSLNAFAVLWRPPLCLRHYRPLFSLLASGSKLIFRSGLLQKSFSYLCHRKQLFRPSIRKSLDVIPILKKTSAAAVAVVFVVGVVFVFIALIVVVAVLVHVGEIRVVVDDVVVIFNGVVKGML